MIIVIIHLNLVLIYLKDQYYHYHYHQIMIHSLLLLDLTNFPIMIVLDPYLQAITGMGL